MYKHKIIDFFNKNIKGKKPDVSEQNQRHDGKFGHWLEKQFNIAANADNQADLYGYELKTKPQVRRVLVIGLQIIIFLILEIIEIYLIKI